MSEPDTVRIVIEQLRARRWAGPDHHPRFEEFLMSESRTLGSRRSKTRLALIISLSAITLTAAAAWVSPWWYTMHGSDGTVRPVSVIDHGDGTMTVTDRTGASETAYVIPKNKPMRMSDMTPEELAALTEEMKHMEGEAVFAKVDGTLVDPAGEEVAVTHDLSGVALNGGTMPGPDKGAKPGAPKAGGSSKN